jgi:hypothetical protein
MFTNESEPDGRTDRQTRISQIGYPFGTLKSGRHVLLISFSASYFGGIGFEYRSETRTSYDLTGFLQLLPVNICMTFETDDDHFLPHPSHFATHTHSTIRHAG